ncbi:MAG: M56 family metallopeptidase [Saccharofermentanales bacterium]
MNKVIFIIIECTITMSVVALLFMIFTNISQKRFTAKSLYVAWLIILIGFLIPFKPFTQMSIINLPEKEITAIKIANIQTVDFENINYDSSVQSRIKSDNVIHMDGIQANGNKRNAKQANKSTAAALFSGVLKLFYEISLLELIFFIWLAGIFFSLLIQIAQYLRFCRLVNRWNLPGFNMNAENLLDALCDEMGIKRKIPLLYCTSDIIYTPMLKGFIKPVVLLPDKIYQDTELYFMLKHELVHYKQGDILYKLLMMMVMALHWFNPIVYFMSKTINSQCEQSCDEKLLKNTTNEQRKIYGYVLINVSTQPIRMMNTLATNFYGGKNEIKKRLSIILNMTKKKRGLAIICISILITFMSGTVFAFSNSPENISINNQDEVASVSNGSVMINGKNYAINELDASLGRITDLSLVNEKETVEIDGRVIRIRDLDALTEDNKFVFKGKLVNFDEIFQHAIIDPDQTNASKYEQFGVSYDYDQHEYSYMGKLIFNIVIFDINGNLVNAFGTTNHIDMIKRGILLKIITSDGTSNGQIISIEAVEEAQAFYDLFYRMKGGKAEYEKKGVKFLTQWAERLLQERIADSMH